MKRARLADGLDVTAIGLGTAPLGGLFCAVSDEDAEATIERAWSLGVRFFDTAPLYGFGLAERRLGGFLRQQKRDSFAISTKVGRLLRSATAAPEDDHYKGTPAERPQFDFSYDGVMRSVEESLARLGLDRVDVLLVHDPDDHYEDAAAGAFRALQRLRADGTVKAIGAGLNQSETCRGPPAESNRPARLRAKRTSSDYRCIGEASEETRDRAGHRGFSRIRCRLQTTTSWSGNRR